ncbi:MAG: autorepressor SdpR family transcription factor [Atopostipes suicloacalis]|nr:autorepressor SdpR family transcription factor [Atopostipes suicloacalis]
MSFQKTFKALADPTRREILELLKKERMAAGEIVNEFDLAGATISRHLSILKEAGLVSAYRFGKYIYYELNTSVLEEVMKWLTDFKEKEKRE